MSVFYIYCKAVVENRGRLAADDRQRYVIRHRIREEKDIHGGHRHRTYMCRMREKERKSEAKNFGRTATALA